MRCVCVLQERLARPSEPIVSLWTEGVGVGKKALGLARLPTHQQFTRLAERVPGLGLGRPHTKDAERGAGNGEKNEAQGTRHLKC